MTVLPDWLVERVLLDEVPAHSAQRVERADPQALADQLAALRAANARELASYPPDPAVAQITARVRAAAAQRRRRAAILAAAASLAAALAVIVVARQPPPALPSSELDDGVRIKGAARLIAFRHSGDGVEQLAADAVVRAGDVIQLRYNAGGRGYGLIASLDGAGGVTLHFPASADAPAQATALGGDSTALPNAYQLDDAPRFERFVFITSNQPIEPRAGLDAVRALAARADAADAPLELPAGWHQWSLRLRKPQQEDQP